MKRAIITFTAVTLTLCSLKAQLTLDQCREMATENYPEIRKYDLIEKSVEIDLSDINKSWLPSLTVYGQGTVQNVVPTFPKALENVLQQMGHDVRGLEKVQYKIGVDMTQTVWDGGVSKARREIARSQKAVQQSAVEVEMYALRQKVDNIYFAILLSEEQIKQSNEALGLLNANLELLRSMYKNGTAMRSDVDMVQAQVLSLKQSIVRAQSSVKGYRRLLGIYIGRDVSGDTLAIPEARLPADMNPNRPELSFFELRKKALETSMRLTQASLMPKLGLFAQAYYGYPGFDYFKSMMNRDLTLNIMAGVRASWSIDSFYTKKNKRIRTEVEMNSVDIDRDVFLFNTRLQTASQLEALNGLKEEMEDDAQIIELRGKVRKAAESQLRNGIIDATELIAKITDENLAKLTAKFHEIQYIQEVYKIKNTLNQ